MKYVSQHLTTHHLLHAPHRWFFALLLSPIHAAELHYQKRYHLKFAHARKLFLFDMLLLLTILGLGSVTAFWYFYDPTIAERIKLTITPLRPGASQEEATRIKSGEAITWVVRYTNQSEQNLRHTRLLLHLPPHFIITSVTPAERFASSTTEFNLNTLPRNASGSVRVHGIFYGTPDHEEHIIAELLYEPDGRPITETKLAALEITLRESVLTAELNAPHKISAEGATPFTLTLKNNSLNALTGVGLSMPPALHQEIGLVSSTAGTIVNGAWQITEFAPQQKVTLALRLRTNFTATQATTSLRLVPYLTLNGTALAQTSIYHPLDIAHPEVSLHGTWNHANASPGAAPVIVLTLTNNGREILNNTVLAIPLPTGLVDVAALRSLNSGKIKNNTYYVTAAENKMLRTLLPGTQVAIPLVVPIAKYPNSNDTDLKLILSPYISTQVEGISGQMETSVELVPLPVGTALGLQSEARYYTAEGDQLGRGPLPPQVGKETKYAVILNFTNGTSEVENVELTANLPAGLVWTGKTSVSQGADLTYNPTTRRVSWGLRRFAAHGQASLFMEVGFTPTEADRGLTRSLLQNLTVQAHDTFIDSLVRATSAPLDTRLKGDTLAQIQGVMVR